MAGAPPFQPLGLDHLLLHVRGMDAAEQIAPSRREVSRPSPRASPTRKPAANKSPAPVVSTSLLIGVAGTSARSAARTASAPSSLRVTTSVSTLSLTAATALSRCG